MWCCYDKLLFTFLTNTKHTSIYTHLCFISVCIWRHSNTASIVTRLYVGLGSIPSRSKIFFSSPNKSRPSLCTQPPIQWVVENPSLHVKWLRHEGDYLSTSRTKVTEFLQLTASLIKHLYQNSYLCLSLHCLLSPPTRKKKNLGFTIYGWLLGLHHSLKLQCLHHVTSQDNRW